MVGSVGGVNRSDICPDRRSPPNHNEWETSRPGESLHSSLLSSYSIREQKYSLIDTWIYIRYLVADRHYCDSYPASDNKGFFQ